MVLEEDHERALFGQVVDLLYDWGCDPAKGFVVKRDDEEGELCVHTHYEEFHCDGIARAVREGRGIYGPVGAFQVVAEKGTNLHFAQDAESELAPGCIRVARYRRDPKTHLWAEVPVETIEAQEREGDDRPARKPEGDSTSRAYWTIERSGEVLRGHAAVQKAREIGQARYWAIGRFEIRQRFDGQILLAKVSDTLPLGQERLVRYTRTDGSPSGWSGESLERRTAR